MKRLAISVAATVVAAAAWAHGLLLDSCLMVTSSLYPDAIHAVSLYVPRQYHDGDTACLYVGLDGVLCDAPAVFDSLIASGEMPVTIGVFLQPGVVRDAVGRAVRYNRCYEFDDITPRFATFLEELIDSHIEGYALPDGRVLHVSRRGDDSAIFGASSGGIAAFTAAWHRPDRFRRVFAAVGTFVAMRGGNDLQAIIRKSEPRPLRVMLQDGTADAWNPLFGSWWEGNQLMASALQFNGIECRFDWGDTGHSIGRASEIFAEVMRWLWRGFPEPVTAGRSANDFLRSIEADTLATGWERKAVDDFAIEVALPPQPMAYYTDSTLVAIARADDGNRIWQYLIDNNGHPTAGEPFYHLHTLGTEPLAVRCMAFDGDGNLWAVTSIGIQVLDQNGRVRAILQLPERLAAADVNYIEITDGAVVLHTLAARYRRSLRVKAPTARPASQGQG